MAFGAQFRNNAGAFQVDGSYPQFMLYRKVQVVANQVINASNGASYTLGTFPLGPGEIAAITCASPAALTRIINGNATVITTGGSGTVIEVFVFGQVTSSGGGFGFQVFNGNGIIVFDAAQKPLAMVGFPQGEGDFYFNGARKYAALCLNQYLQITDNVTGNGGFINHRVRVTRGFIQALGGGIRITNILYRDNTDTLDPNDTPLDNTVPAGAPNRHIIVDVTYF
jgi:hypothetical protein